MYKKEGVESGWCEEEKELWSEAGVLKKLSYSRRDLI